MEKPKLSQDDLKQLLDQLRVMAKQAGEKIMRVYERGFHIETKTDDSPVTEADMGAHEVIVDGLQNLPQVWPVLSEESVDIPFSARQQWDTYWLVDPLDGTREFINRSGEFTVNIALIQGNESILGVIYVPVYDLFYYAAKGLGAYKYHENNPPSRIHCRKKGPDQIVVAGSRSFGSDKLNRYLDNLGQYELLSMGSSLKSCLVAEGAADIYPRLGLTSEWDTAAAQCVVEEAGGHITDVSGHRLMYNTKDSLLNPYFLVFGDETVDWRKYIQPGDEQE